MPKGIKQSKAPSADGKDRAKLTAEESLKRMQEFNKRKEEFVATVRKGTDRSVSA